MKVESITKISSAGDAKESSALGARAPAFASLLTVLAVATVYSTQAIFGELASSFHVELERTRLSFSIASLCYALAFFVLGPLTDRFSKARIALVGAAGAAATMLIASRMQDFDLFLIAMGSVGAFAAAVPVAMFPYMAQIAPKDRVGSYMGLIVSASIVGIIIGRSVVGILAATWGWRIAFVALAALLGLAALGTTALANPDAGEQAKPPSLWAAYGRAGRLFTTGPVTIILLAGFLLFFGYLGMITFLTFRLREAPFNFTSSGIGWVSFTGMTAIAGAPLAGALSNKLGQRALIVFGMSVALVAMQLMAWPAALWAILIGMMALYLGVFSCQPSLLVLMTKRAPREVVGSASALYLLACLGGGSVASSALGPIWSSAGWAGVSIACTLAVGAAFALALATTRSSPVSANS